MIPRRSLSCLFTLVSWLLLIVGGPAVEAQTTAAETGAGSAAATASDTLPVASLTNTGYLAEFTNDLGAVGNSPLFDSGGNIGLGTTTPVLPLEVVKNAASHDVMRVQNLNPGYSSSVLMQNDVGTTTSFLVTGSTQAGLPANTGFMATFSNTPLGFLTGGAERMRITADGKLGLGTAAPAAEAGRRGHGEGNKL